MAFHVESVSEAYFGMHSGCVAAAARPEGLAPRVRKLREAAARHGRGREDLRVLASLTVIVAPTDAKAAAQHAEYESHIDLVGSLVRLSAFIGTDLSKLAVDELIRAGSANAIASVVENLTKGRPTGPGRSRKSRTASISKAERDRRRVPATRRRSDAGVGRGS